MMSAPKHDIAPGREAFPTLQVQNLRTHFFTKAGIVKAVDDVSFNVKSGEVLGIVGESGSGKSVTGFSILGLVEFPGRIVSGSILFKNEELVGVDESQLQSLRGNRIAMIFQDPMMTLNPVLRIDTQMIETIQAHRNLDRKACEEEAYAMLELVGIPSPGERLKNYPHQLSGGMRQRIAIAIAFLNKPDLIIADEPTTALDVTIQAQIIHEAQQLCQKTGTALIWITHDLAVVAGIADRICVMYAGRIVESGDTSDVIDNPKHPYTHGLIGSVPSHNKRGEPLFLIPGMTPSLLNLGPECAFQSRCSSTTDACSSAPEIQPLDEDRTIRCHNPLQGGEER